LPRSDDILQIQQKSGFGNLLIGELEEYVLLAARAEKIVVLNVTELRSDATLVTKAPSHASIINYFVMNAATEDNNAEGELPDWLW